MANERLRTTIAESEYSERTLAEHLGLDPKSVQRWVTRNVTPRRRTAQQAAKLLQVQASWLWPDLITVTSEERARSEVVAFYPHRCDVPRRLWRDLLTGAKEEIWLFANASLFLAEENPDSIQIIRRKAEEGARVRILLGDPDSLEMELRGVEERLYDAIPGRIRMALTYYSALVEVPGIEFLLHRTSLYNSIFRYDDQLLINQHVYGTYGYMAPILHLRRVQGADLFDMYIRSFERVHETAKPIQESTFWSQRAHVFRPAGHA